MNKNNAFIIKIYSFFVFKLKMKTHNSHFISMMEKPAFVIWWDSPCKGMISVLGELSQLMGADNCRVITGDTGKHRRSMGWRDIGSCFKEHLVIQRDENWEKNTLTEFRKHPDAVHIFNGITRPIFRHLITEAQHKGIKHIFMTEAYSNLLSGWKKRLKSLYMRCVLPFKVRPYAKQSLGIICLSGKRDFELQQLAQLGFPRERIFPFGYWTKSRSHKIKSLSSEHVSFLCPGVLEKYKGVDILLHAVADLKKINPKASFSVNITGRGTQELALRKLAAQLGITDKVIFHGALPEDDFRKLISYTDVLIAPGRFEPWGIRINEAIQRGEAVICSDGLGAAYLVSEFEGGIVFPSGDVKALVNAMIELLNNEKLAIAKQNNILHAEEISPAQKARQLYEYLHQLVQN